MDRTRKILMGVTASALLAAGHASTDSSLAMDSASVEPNLHATVIDAASRYYYPQTGHELDESLGRRTAILAITKVLNGVQEQNALTLDEILARRSDVNRKYAEKVIPGLLNRGEIRRTGDGTQAKPFRYYDRARSGSGG